MRHWKPRSLLFIQINITYPPVRVSGNSFPHDIARTPLPPKHGEPETWGHLQVLLLKSLAEGRGWVVFYFPACPHTGKRL